MARYTDSVCRICRREGAKLFLKGTRCYTKKCAFERRPSPPGQHGVRRRKVGEYGLQLREKQKVRKTYGVLERQFRNYFRAASKHTGVTGEYLLRTLELRFDNVVYRAGFAPSRASARQLVAHGHLAVNGRPTDIPSYQLKAGDKIEVREARRARAIQGRQGDPAQPPGSRMADHRPRDVVRDHRHAAQPRPDAARSQRAARGRVLLEVTGPT
jgi:small subunit ribosomal protein S4